jgi:predicted type IV restriction endonuclease
MATQAQKDKLQKKLREYKKRYLTKKYAELDESATRLMINSFLTEVLGYTELDDIKTEYIINGTYADYIIQLDRKKRVVIEVKAIQIDLSEKHLRQAINYAANEGIDWVLLTNGKQFELHRVIFKKPITHKRIFSFNLTEKDHFKESIEYFPLLTKKAMLKDELDDFWLRFQALEPNNLCKTLYSEEVIKLLRRALKKNAQLSFSEEDIFDSIHQIIVKKIPFEKPNKPLTLIKKTKKKSPPKVETSVVEEHLNE